MMKLLSLIVLFAIIPFSNQAQVPAANTSADIYMQLKKLTVLGSVLYIAAHPDDENNGLLPYLAKEKLYRTAYLSLTRGDGGQNLIGSEQGIELGMIRTQELLAARRMDGAGQFFSRAYEFGFSKSSDEALQIWDKEKILSDVVWIIRQYQPDVIIKRFPPDKRAGHGHHAASSIIADEAFKAAADPNRFPEQLRFGVKPWQAKRILWNTYNFGGNNTTSDDQLKIEVGGYNPLLGKSYGEIGGEARSMHKSQGEGRPRRRGDIWEYFTTLAGAPATTSLMDGVTDDWTRIKGGEKVEEMLNNILGTFQFLDPGASVPALVKLYATIEQLPESVWKEVKLTETQNIIEECAGLFTEAVTQQEYAVQGDNLQVSLSVNNRAGVQASLKKVSIVSAEYLQNQRLKQLAKPLDNSANASFKLDTLVQQPLNKNQNVNFNLSFKIDDNAPVSQPYWLENEMKPGYFDVTDTLLIGDAESKPAYTATFTVQIEGKDFTIQQPVQYKYTDPVRGELYEPLTITPKMIVSISPSVVLSSVAPKYTPPVTVNYISNISASKVPLTISLRNGTSSRVVKKETVDLAKGTGASIPIYLDSLAITSGLITPEVSIAINGNQQAFNKNLATIKYEHIPNINYFYTDKLKVVNEAIKTVGKKVGYVVGAGDKVPEALMAMGYDVHYLTETDLNDENLQQYQAIVIGVRAYNIFDFLTTKNSVLNRYIFNGGNLIVQYMKNNQVGLRPVQVGPYPFTVTSTRVTEENAEVNFLLPAHPALNYPNKITAADFNDWVQERSTYQSEQSDLHFQKLLSMHDTGESPSSGSLMVAGYGKGNIIYTGLVLFRQLPAGVAGAYRLMANLIALPKNK